MANRKSIRKCSKCGSCWPAMVTLEAVHNYQRQGRIHPGESCRDEDGKFGPEVRMTIDRKTLANALNRAPGGKRGLGPPVYVELHIDGVVGTASISGVRIHQHPEWTGPIVLVAKYLGVGNPEYFETVPRDGTDADLPVLTFQEWLERNRRAEDAVQDPG